MFPRNFTTIGRTLSELEEWRQSYLMHQRIELIFNELVVATAPYIVCHFSLMMMTRCHIFFFIASSYCSEFEPDAEDKLGMERDFVEIDSYLLSL